MRKIIVGFSCVTIFTLLIASTLWAEGQREGATTSSQQQSIVAFMPVHHFTSALQQLLPQFENSTGIKVQLSTLPEEEYYKKTTIELASGKPSFDVFLLNQGYVPEYAVAGWVQPLEQYINDPKLTNRAKYDFADFPSAALSRPTYAGKLYGIPATVEPQIMFYRKDILQSEGIPVPKTIEDLYNAAVKIKRDVPGMSGIALRLKRGTGSYWPWLGLVSDYRGQWVGRDGKDYLTSTNTEAATAMYINLIKDGGPTAPLNYGWYECLTSFQQGKTAFLLDANSWMASFQDPSKSKVVGKVGAAVMPAGPDGYIQAAGGSSWMIGMASASKNKDGAWKFMEWASSKPIALKIAIIGGDVARSSIWTDPQFKAKYPYPDWIQASSMTTDKYNSTYFLPTSTKLSAMSQIIDIALEDIYDGKSLSSEMANAQQETDALLK